MIFNPFEEIIRIDDNILQSPDYKSELANELANTSEWVTSEREWIEITKLFNQHLQNG